jgi:hypothetical protein
MLIQRFDVALRALQRANGQTRRSLAAVVVDRCAEMARAADSVVDWLTEKESWFARNPTHPKFEQREDAWIAKLREYEALCDAIGRTPTVRGLEVVRAS